MTVIYQITTKFERGYIADPYWTELSALIDITKKSGMNRAKSDANRRKALEEYLNRNDMTLADYERLEKQAKEPFYRNTAGAIIIPELHVSSHLVNICYEARAATRPCAPEQVRSRFVVSPWTTKKTMQDGVYERFARPQGGTGAKLSNQRGLRRNPYIANFTAVGTIEFEPEFVEPKALLAALEYGGKFVGVGASRKMGWGRYEIIEFDKH